MVKHCNDSKRNLEIDETWSYKKNTCKQFVIKKVECD